MKNTIPKTIVVGAQSFIARNYIQAYKKITPEILLTDIEFSDPKLRLDLLHPSLDHLPLDNASWKFALITAAMPNVNFCEQNKKTSHLINVTGTLKLAEMLTQKGIIPIIFSSDYVFDGKIGNYNEYSPVNPNTEYGKQKAELEKQLLASGDNHLILRLSKVYSTQKGDGSLLDEMIQTLLDGKKIKAAYDQIFCPIHIDNVIEAILKLQQNQARGLFNLCTLETHSRYELALKVAKALNLPSESIEKISLNDLPGHSSRPKNTTMSSQKLTDTIPIKIKSIDEAIEGLLSQYV